MYQDRFRYSRDILGRDAFIDLLSEFHMMVRITVRKPRTTDSTHGLPTYPNLAYDFVPVRVNHLWVSDITYITIWKGDGTYSFCYLSLILDAYSKEIVGWSLGESLRTTYPLNALEMALRRLPEDTDGLIHHSNRGVQYASSEYIRRLTARGIRISMTEKRRP